MNVIVCMKVVPESQDIQVMPNKDISLDKAALTISDYDLNALEAGTIFAEQSGGTMMALTVGAAKIDESKLKKNILSRGAGSLTMVADEAYAQMGTYETANALAAAIKKIGQWDVILCGEGSADMYTQQVGMELGELLGVPVLNSVVKIEAGSGKLSVDRSLEDEVESVEVSLPCVLAVSPEMNTPRVPSMKEIMAAGKKPVTVWKSSDISSSAKSNVEVVSVKAPASADRKQIIIEGDSDDKIEEFIKKIAPEFKG